MKTIFDKYFRKYDSWYDKNRNAFLSELRTIRKILPKKGKGLEIGVGTGRFASALGIVYGIDPSSSMVKIASERGVNAVVGVGEHLPFPDNTFGYVLIVNTLCFVSDISIVLKEALRVLKERGKIVVGIIEKDSFLGKYYRKKKSVFYNQARFLRTEELKAALKIAGFSRFFVYQSLFSFPEAITGSEKLRMGFGQGGFVVIAASKSKYGRILS